MFALRIADFALALDVSPEPLERELAASYAAFVVPGAQDAARIAVRGRGATAPPPPARMMPRSERQEDALVVTGEDFVARLLPQGGTVEGPPERFPTDSTLKLWLADRLLEHEGLLLHGVTVAGPAGAITFVGHSGAGKSTLGGLAREGGLEVLSDELCAVTWTQDGPVVHGTPWNVGTPSRARLLGLGVLEHAPSHLLEPWPAAEVLRMLLPNTLLADPGAQGRARVFKAASRLLSTVEAFRLSFAVDSAVAHALRPVVERTG